MVDGLEIRLVAENEIDSWDAFVEGAQAGSLFHTSVWRRVINSSYGDGTYAITGMWSEGELVAGFCALARRRLGVLTAVTPLCTPYCGVVQSGSVGYIEGAMPRLLRHLQVYQYQNLQLAPGYCDVALLKEMGYQLTPRRTLEINLRLPEEELWEGFHGNVRRNVRKAEKAGFDITDQWDGDLAYEMYCGTFKRQGELCPVGRGFFNEISEGPILADYRRRYVAWKDGIPQAFLVALRWGSRVYYELAATSDEARTTGVSSLLIWEMLRDHLGREFEIFDFVGGNTATISSFKEKFNPTEKVHLAAELCLSKRIRIGRAMRDFIRRR